MMNCKDPAVYECIQYSEFPRDGRLGVEIKRVGSCYYCQYHNNTFMDNLKRIYPYISDTYESILLYPHLGALY